jgi:hypothetical protein
MTLDELAIHVDQLSEQVRVLKEQVRPILESHQPDPKPALTAAMSAGLLAARGFGTQFQTRVKPD